MKQKGFTLIELLIVVVIIGTLATIVFGVAEGGGGSSSMSFGVNGLTETRCINGYLFNVGSNGSTQQILNENGGGIRCGK